MAIPQHLLTSIFLITLLLALFANAQAPWPTIGHDIQNSFRASSNTPLPSEGLCVTPLEINAPNSILPSDDTIILNGDQQYLFDSTTLDYIEPLKNITIFGANLSDPIIFVANFTEKSQILNISAIDSASNELIWNTSFPSVAIYYASYNNIDNTIDVITSSYANSTDTIFNHLNATNGTILWTMSIHLNLSEPVYVLSGPGQEYFAIQNNHLDGYNLQTFNSSNGYLGYRVSTSVIGIFHKIKDQAHTLVTDQGLLVIGLSEFITANHLYNSTSIFEIEVPEFLAEINSLVLLEGTEGVPSPIVAAGNAFINAFVHVYSSVNGNEIVSAPKGWIQKVTAMIAIGNSIVVSGYQSNVPVTYLVDIDLMNNVWGTPVLIAKSACSSLVVQTDGSLFGACTADNSPPQMSKLTQCN